ncbi:MAG: hypothetical protein RR704_07200 [Stenotrophomonas sp.]
MLRILRGVGRVLLGLVLTVIAVWLLSRFWPLTGEQRQDIQRLQAVQPPQGRNGFALLWTLQFDGLDMTQREVALAQDLQRWQATPEQQALQSILAVDHPRVASSAVARCNAHTADCLAQVRRDPQRFADAHAGHAGLHARLGQLADFDRFDSPFQASGTAALMPFPEYVLLFDGSAVSAQAFAQGDTAAALDSSCRALRFGRRLMHTGSTLLDSMMGAALVRSSAQLLGDMLVELPPDHALPAACAAALQPLQADEQSLCRAMQGEFAMNTAAVDASIQSAGAGLLLDRDHTLARVAGKFGWACRPAAAEALAADLPLSVPPPSRWDVGCLANALGCTLSDIAGPAYVEYAARSQDAAAMVRLLGAQRWLRQQTDPPAQALTRLPPQWHSPARTPTVSADGRYLQVAQRAPARDGEQGPYLSIRLRAD